MFYFERLLERISVSKYKDNFILKGGMLISAMLGIDSRTTMDMDTTIKGFALTEENINNIMNEICNIDLQDDVTLKIKKIEQIINNNDGKYIKSHGKLHDMWIIYKNNNKRKKTLSFIDWACLYGNESEVINNLNIEDKYKNILKKTQKSGGVP